MSDYADIRNMIDSSDEYFAREIIFLNECKPKFDLLFKPFYKLCINCEFKDQLKEIVPENFFNTIELKIKITSDEINSLLSNTKKIIKEEIINISLCWKRLEKENADLRLIGDNKLVSRDYDFLDNKILEKLNTYVEPVNYYSFGGNLMANRMYGLCTGLFFSARLDYLIEIGKIEIVEIRKEKNIIGELVDYKYIKINKY